MPTKTTEGSIEELRPKETLHAYQAMHRVLNEIEDDYTAKDMAIVELHVQTLNALVSAIAVLSTTTYRKPTF